MDEKKRSDTYQADCVTQKPTHRGRPVFTPGNAVIGDQGYDTKNRCSCCRGRAQHNVADHIPTATQPQIDLRGPAQYVGCRAITESAPRGTEGIAEGYERLSNRAYHGLTPNRSAITRPMAGYQVMNPSREIRITSGRFSSRYSSTNERETSA